MKIRGIPLYFVFVLFILSKGALSKQKDSSHYDQELNSDVNRIEVKESVVIQEADDNYADMPPAAKYLEFRIQVLAYKNKKKAPEGYFSELRKIGPIRVEKHNNYKIFTIGSYNSYSEARLRLKRIKKIKHDAFVVVFIDNKRLNHISEINPYIMDQRGIPASGTAFRIHITETTDRPVSIIELAYRYNLRISDILEEKKDGKYIYTARSFIKIKEAFDYAEELRTKNLVAEPYIMKYIDGRQVNTAFSSVLANR